MGRKSREKWQSRLREAVKPAITYTYTDQYVPLDKFPVYKCSTEFQQWLWWTHKRSRKARLIARLPLPISINDNMEVFVDEALAFLCKYYILDDDGMIHVRCDEWSDGYSFCDPGDMGNYLKDLYLDYFFVVGIVGKRAITFIPHPEKISTQYRFRILKRDNFTCCLCGIQAQHGARLEVDHIIPKAKGGSNYEWNLWTLCWACNNGKSDRCL